MEHPVNQSMPADKKAAFAWSNQGRVFLSGPNHETDTLLGRLSQEGMNDSELVRE